jgi:hypothetical protein
VVPVCSVVVRLATLQLVGNADVTLVAEMSADSNTDVKICSQNFRNQYFVQQY